MKSPRAFLAFLTAWLLASTAAEAQTSGPLSPSSA
jgi:hypothetical protein